VGRTFYWSTGVELIHDIQLPFHCQWQDLKDLFRQAGAVVRADVTLGVDGRSRGFGTVVYASEGDADRAVKMFNGSGVLFPESMLSLILSPTVMNTAAVP
jgi:RNA recognition motif-containing protein